MIGPDSGTPTLDSREMAAVAAALTALDAELVGLESVKAQVERIVDALGEDDHDGAAAHMCFSGDPGAGKTTVAERMAAVLHPMGVVRGTRTATVPLAGADPDEAVDLIEDALAAAEDGVLVVRDAQELAAPEFRAALDVLVRALLASAGPVVIFTGDRPALTDLLAARPELDALVPHRVDFPSYRFTELRHIAEAIVVSSGFRFDSGARQAFSEYLQRRMREPGFAAARTVRNAIDRCRLQQSFRLLEPDHTQTAEDLITLTAADVRGATRSSGERSPGECQEQLGQPLR